MQETATVTLATHRWTVRLPAEFGHADVTPELQALVGRSGVQTGVLAVQLVGSTGAITCLVAIGYWLWAVPRVVRLRGV